MKQNDNQLLKMRLATLDSTDSMNTTVYDDSDWKMGVLWWSALSPSSKVSHIERHGRIYSTNEVRDFYTHSENVEGCLCSLSPILFNVKTGEVLQTELIEKMVLARNEHLKTLRLSTITNQQLDN